MAQKVPQCPPCRGNSPQPMRVLSFDSQNHLTKQILISPFYKWGNWGQRRWRCWASKQLDWGFFSATASFSWISVIYSQKNPVKFWARQSLVSVSLQKRLDRYQGGMAGYIFCLLTRKMTSFTFKLPSCTYTIFFPIFLFEFISSILFYSIFFFWQWFPCPTPLLFCYFLLDGLHFHHYLLSLYLSGS